MKENRLSLAFLGLLIAASPLRAQDTPQTETAEQKDKRMEWFSQAKLGIFIHWGIYSVRGVSESCREGLSLTFSGILQPYSAAG